MGLRHTLQANTLELKLEAEQKHLTRSQKRNSELAHVSRRTIAELRLLKHRSISLAQNINSRARMIARIETELIRLTTKVNIKKENLLKTQNQLALALGALQRIARTPTMANFIVPRSPYKIRRSLMILEASVPQLKIRISKMGSGLKSLIILGTKQKAQKQIILNELTQMAADRQQLEAIVSEKLRLFRLVSAEEKYISTKISHISTRASNIQELLGKLTQNKLTQHDNALKPSSQFVYTNENSVLPAPMPNDGASLPVLGRVVQTFGTTLLNGAKSKGISIATSAAAAVVAPREGQIVFAGTFRSYGKLVIVELPNQGYALIAGMGKINAEVGDQVFVGEPVGEMPTSTLETPKLYFELRRNGHPVNPMPKTSASRQRAPGQG